MLKKIFSDKAAGRIIKSAVGIIMATTLVGVTPSQTVAQQKANIVGIDHVGINVPDLKQAVDFFSDVLGFTPVTTLGPISLNAAWKEASHMNTETGAVTIKMVNAGTGASIEVFAYDYNHGSKQFPGGDDIGATHIAFYTTDIKEAVAYLKSKDVKVLGDPFVVTSGDTEGETWVYFLSPWGSKLELTSYPDGKGYQKNNPKVVLWSPKDAAQKHAEDVAPTEGEVKSLIERHLELWNEQDVHKRKEIMDAIYSPDIEMVDRNFIANGLDQVDAFVKDLHAKNPDFRFSHVKPIDQHHNIARLFWQVGNKANPAAVTGMDLFIIENGRVKKLYVFVDGK